MRTRSLVFLLCLLCLAGAWLLWPRPVNTRTKPSAPPNAAAPAAPASPAATASKILTPVYANSAKPGTVPASTNPFAFRLSNTTKTLDQLMHDSHAILLENALIDLNQPLTFSIPKNLQSQGDPGAYIVQARGPIDAAFRAMLAQAGAEIVSYIPNDAYLVRAQSGVANGLAGNPLTQAVTPYEPYYKISSSIPVTVGQKTFSSVSVKTNRAAGPSLLTLAVKQAPLPAGTCLTLGLFSDGAAATIKQIEKLGGRIVARDRSPFGPVVRVQPPQDWVALAILPGVQIVEPYHKRIHANDLSRVTVGVATNAQTTVNYLGLSGQNVIVQVNDSGIDDTHPDFTTGGNRVIGDPANLVDTDGHGTHVAGIIAGNGSMSTTVTNASGSIMPAKIGQFRGMAPKATLLAMNLFDSDQELQEAAALTNALISNNSWNNDGDNAYDLAAASYDAAVRDALPGVTGSQPVLFVFSAGNEGGGSDSSDFGGGNADTILSPATAKNVITVGALQESRNITNQVITISASGVTNSPSTPWQPETSTSYRVAGFSSRGNVGIGTECTYGRYKPDVVAPGTFVVSTRSSQWDIADYFYINPTNHTVNTLGGIIVQPDDLWANQFPVIPNYAIQVAIYVTPNADSPVPFPDLPIYFGLVGSPAYPYFTTNNQVLIPPDGGLNIASILGSQKADGFNYGVSNSTTEPISFDVTTDVVTTNNPGNYFLVLSNLNQFLGTPNQSSTGPGPYYRYETGTSMAAADVSGVLALMQDYFTNTLHATPSPALLKAMLINGARTTDYYNFQAQNSLNYEGWGLINLTNALPPGIMTGLSSSGSMLILDQSPANALATGDSHTFQVTITGAATNLPLRITLAWTDPPGDPAAAIKLVNDLNLVVTNLDHPTNVYYGNDIPASSTYNSIENSTNPPVFDSINNVENIYLPKGAGANFSVTVLGYRVNVNAVTAHPNNVVQDYALVISSGNGTVTNAFTVTDNPIISNPTADQQITYVVSTNAPLLNQFVGASTPLLGTNQIQLTGGGTELNGIQLSPTNVLVTLGMTNQWHFYVVTNTGASDFTNAAFITFIPNTLAVPRMGVFANPAGTSINPYSNVTRPEADIDLYVSTDARLMNLDPVVISNADKSVGRGGTEFVYYTNSAPGKVYYVGVYSEDQEASEYGFVPIFTDIPFSQPGPNGSQIVNGLTLPVNIPDGTPAHPGSAYVFALAINPMEAKRVVVTNVITHQNFGDLIGTLTHSQQTGLGQRDVLNNHDSLYNDSGIYTQIFDDSGQGDIAGSQPSDGPGSLNNFVGQQAIGPWILTEVDDSHTQIGGVTGFNMLIEPHQDLTKGIYGTVEGGSWFYDYIDVPAWATNLTISATNTTMPSPQPIFLYVNTNSEPTLTNFIAMTGLTNPGPTGPGGTISIPPPPLAPGRYWVGIWNPNVAAQNFTNLIVHLGLGTAPGQVIFSSSGPAPILDDAVITNSIFVTENQPISSVDVALRVDHPRVSDLVFHLISPDGTRVLLVENRGGLTTNGMGTTLAITNMAPVRASGSELPSTNVINAGQPAGTLQVQYNFYNLPDQMVVYDQGGGQIFDSGMISGAGVFDIPYSNSLNLTIEMNPFGNNGFGDLWNYTVSADQAYYDYLVLTEDTNKTTTPIKFAPVPFQGTATINTNAVWHSSFEGGPAGDSFYNSGDYFPEGWHVDAGGVKVLTDGGAYEGTHYLDLDGTNSKSGPGTISTNLVTSPGQTYILSFAYSPNPFAFKLRPDGLVSGVRVLQNIAPLLTLSVTNNGQSGAPTWATTSIVFTATSASTKLVFESTDGPQVQGPGSVTNGVLLDAINLATVNVTNGDIYYQPEQSLDTYTSSSENAQGQQLLAGENAYGQWQLEIQDDRAGAYATNLCQLVSWQLRFNFPTAVSSSGITNGLPQTNTIPAGSIQYYEIDVPPNADIATNILISTGGPLNLWFDTNYPPTTNILLLSGTTNGTSILYTNGVPPLIPGSTYYLVVQNTNSGPVNYSIEVDFHFVPPVNVLTNGLPVTNSLPAGGIDYYLVTVPTNADWATNLLLSANVPLNVWFNPTNLPVTTHPPDILVFGNATSGSTVFGTNTPPTSIVPGGTYYLAVQNTNSVSAIYGLEVDFHLVWPSVPAGGIVYYPVTVPPNADYATNILVFASGPLNLWYDTNNPSTTNILLLRGTNGSVVLSAGTTPPLVPGSTYYLGVQNTNSFPVSYLIEVYFHLLSATNIGAITDLTITATKIGGTNGFLLQWQGPTNFQYEIQWTIDLLPPIIWNTVLNPLINETVTATNGHFSWFDNGTLTGGLGTLKFYRVLGGLNLGLITGSGPATNTVLAGAMSQAVVAVPAKALWASNVLLSATGPLNVWFNQTNPPTGNTNAGDILMLSNSTAGVFVLNGGSVPPLVPGTNYYLGFQNPGASNVTFVFDVTFGFPATNAVSHFSITATNGGVWLKWNGLTNYVYQVQWTTSLLPPAAWNTIPNLLLSSTTGIFTFFDNGSLTGGFGPLKFYRLIAWPLPPTPQTLSFSSVTITNIAGTNDLMLRWSAPTNYQYAIQWTTNLALPFTNWFLIANPVLTQTNGVYTFIDNGQTGSSAATKFFRLFEY